MLQSQNSCSLDFGWHFNLVKIKAHLNCSTRNFLCLLRRCDRVVNSQCCCTIARQCGCMCEHVTSTFCPSSRQTCSPYLCVCLCDWACVVWYALCLTGQFHNEVSFVSLSHTRHLHLSTESASISLMQLWLLARSIIPSRSHIHTQAQQAHARAHTQQWVKGPDIIGTNPSKWYISHVSPTSIPTCECIYPG